MGLHEITLFGELDRMQLAVNRLRLNEPKEGYYVAFSGGKYNGPVNSDQY